MKDYSVYFKKPSLKEARRRSREPSNINYDGVYVPDDMHGIGKGKKYYIRTYGCQGNQADGETISGILELLGYEKSANFENSHIILLNTCAIRENAHNKVFGEVGALKKLKANNPEIVIGVCGCMAQEEGVVEKLLRTYPQVDLIFGTHNINRIPILLREALFSKEKVVEVLSIAGEVVENLPVARESKLKAWVNIMFGCDKFCTYCIVPFTRGKERSRLKEDIISEVEELVKDGYQEVTLLGQNVNAYGQDLDTGYDFANLLEEVAKTGIPRIRFVTSHPWNFSDEMIRVIAEYDNVMPYIHLPLQSGDDDILAKMSRRYTVEEYKGLYYKLRNRVKNCSITTDIIVGFPGESEAQFENTLKLVKELDFDSAYTFIYSPREGTPASKMRDDVTHDDKKVRLQKLIKEVSASALKINKEYVGRTLKVLVEGTSKKNEEILSGYSEENKLVNFKGRKDDIGKIIKVKITGAKTWTLQGEQVDG